MIEIKCLEELAKVTEFALNNNCLESLYAGLRRLAKYGEDGFTCILYSDHAPNSFGFSVLRPDSSRYINGGLIYSGPKQPLNGSGPAFTVGIGIDSSRHNWSLHT